MFFSIGTLLGIVGSIGLFILAIIGSTDNYIVFLSIPSLLMVLGGTLAASFIAYQGLYVIRALKALVTVILPFHVKPSSLLNDAKQIVHISSVLRSKGLLAVEKELSDYTKTDPFLSFAITLLTSKYESSAMRDMLSDNLESTFERHLVQSNILQSMASFSPAFGMIGTLVGLIIMLGNMGSDISNIGQGLALALITTLYGILLAQIVFLPASEKLRQRYEIMRHRNIVVMEGFIMLNQGKSYYEIQDKLNSLLDFNYRLKSDNSS